MGPCVTRAAARGPGGTAGVSSRGTARAIVPVVTDLDSPPPVEPLDPAIVVGLGEPGAYPGDPSASAGMAHLQTHLSHVFLTGERAYKLRKAVSFDFVDFSRRAERNADCLRELRLNRRLAPDVYLGLAPLRVGPGGVRVGPLSDEPTAPSVEHCVVMRRLPEGRDALSLLQGGRLRADQVAAVAQLIARFHGAHRLAPPPFSSGEWRARVEAPVRESFGELARSSPGPGRAAPGALAARRAARFTREAWPRFERRRARGRIVDGHGDLHLQHVWFETDASPPLPIDCLEFRDDYRCVDAASDVAFLAMDLTYRGRSDLAERFLADYAAHSDDFDLYGVVDYFIGYRAAVRAKVAALAAGDPGLSRDQRCGAARSARAHVALAARALEPRGGGRLCVVSGGPVAGRRRAALALAERTGGVLISAAGVRRRLGRPGSAPPGAAGETDLRAAEQALYRALCERADPVVGSGRVAILEAPFARAEQRAAVLAWARERGVRPLLLEVGRSARAPLGDGWPAPDRACVSPDRDGLEDAARRLGGGAA